MLELVESGQLVLVAASGARVLGPDAVLLLYLLAHDLRATLDGPLDRVPLHAEELGNGSDEPILRELLVDERDEDGLERVLVGGVARAPGLEARRDEGDDVGHKALIQARGLVEPVGQVDQNADLGQLQHLAEDLRRVGQAARRRKHLIGDGLGLLRGVAPADRRALAPDSRLKQRRRLLPLAADQAPRDVPRHLLRRGAGLRLHGRAAAHAVAVRGGSGGGGRGRDGIGGTERRDAEAAW